MADKQVITEEMGVHKEWIAQARAQTPATISEFLRHLIEDYEHDYGTICHAISAAAVGAAYSIERSPQGGITGFQSGCVMWEFITGWDQTKEGKGMRLVDYDDLLYPQMEYKFRTITKETADALPAKAQELLAGNPQHAHPAVRAHWEQLAAGVIPFGLAVGA